MVLLVQGWCKHPSVYLLFIVECTENDMFSVVYIVTFCVLCNVSVGQFYLLLAYH